jgi:hypothetical protein
MISPFFAMLALLAVTAGAAWAGRVIRSRRSARVAALAAAWRMSYTRSDRFDITPTVAARFPTPGAADIVLRDLIYAPGPDAGAGLRYLFTVEYTTGVLRTKRRRMGVGMLVERTDADGNAAAAAVTLAPPGGPLPAQYEHLREQFRSPLSLPLPSPSPDLPPAPLLR